MIIEIPKFKNFEQCYSLFISLPSRIKRDETLYTVLDKNLDLEIEATGLLIYDQVVYYKNLLKGGRSYLDANKHKVVNKWKQENPLM